MVKRQETRYLISRSEQSIFSEIYFPKRAAYYGTIFDALRKGYKEDVVKKYMDTNAPVLLEEYQAYPALFDPDDYTKARRVTEPVSVEKARERIKMYQSPFKGWSTYSVDGVFFDKKNKMYEEAVQVVRIMFRFQSSFALVAEKEGCSDVLRCMLVWLATRQGRLAGHKIWFESEKRLFVTNQPPFPKRKRAFVEQHFASIAREVNKWIDDRGLFTFAYLVHKFAENVLAEQLYEKEIWATNLFNQNLIITSRVENGENHITQK
ncbi:MAG: hypothetical protein G01um101417_314 [Parcubacteria group bacterium Gr01-1014_17]|nr:MAG: hypothetical protein G01um101417_314 [Parcubacteria group bacterium Gr01-1014_17]